MTHINVISTLSKLEILIIRACKAEEPVIRLESLYRRFWYSNGNKRLAHAVMSDRIISILFKMSIDKERMFRDTLSCINPENLWKHGLDPNDYHEIKVLAALVSQVRYTKNTDLPEGFIPPSRFRRNK